MSPASGAASGTIAQVQRQDFCISFTIAQRRSGVTFQQRHGTMNRRNLLARFLLAGALVGTLAGIGEGVLLYTVPRNRVLLEPEVGPPVLFIAPLVCLVVFAAVGGGLGAMACLRRPPSPTRIAVLEAVGLSVVGAYGVAFVRLIQVWRVTSRTVVLEPRTWATFALILLSLFLMVRWRGLPAGDFLTALSPRRIRQITLLVVVAAGGCLLSLGYILASRGSGPVSAHAAAAAQSSPPNLVLITLDTVRADHLSVYGYHR